LVIVDEDRVDTSADFTGIKIPIVRIAQEASGKSITANTVALGVLVGLTGLVSRGAIEKAITARAPKGTEEMNRKALQAGFAAAEQVRVAAVASGPPLST
jgi:2-oxoglutarate ferredoxin oxidoreductase subunit gamma